MNKVCKVDGCNEKHLAKGFCTMHYNRFKRTNKTNLDVITDFKGEVWKDINEYEGIYQISNFSRVKSLDRIDSKGLKRYGKIMAISTAKNGYKVVAFCKNGMSKMFKIHRLVASAFIPNIEGKPMVNHIDGNKQNNYIGNLEWCTGSENMIHAYKTGLQVAVSGENHYRYNKEIHK